MRLDDWSELPPELAAYARAQAAVHAEEYALVLRFAPFLCTCTPWYDHRRRAPAQEECFIHTSVAITTRGMFTLGEMGG